MAKAKRSTQFKIARQRNAIALMAIQRKAGAHKKTNGQLRRAAGNALVQELAELTRG
jgi:hypothetical protein